MRPALLLAATLLAAVGGAARAAPFTVVETGRGYGQLQEAVSAIGDGDGTIRIAPGRYDQCAVQSAGRVAYVAEARGTAIFAGRMCDGKAALVLDGRAAHVEGLVFTRMTVPDGNGAGIRIQQGDLTVSYVKFVDGQCGILSADDPKSSIAVDHSTFSGLGKHPNGNGAHALYIGEYGALKVTDSRFERGTGGHYLKSRAARIEVLNSSFDDSAGRDTNYMIDLPGGASGLIADNSFVNGLGKENHGTMITVAPEGQTHPASGLVIERNRALLVPGYPWSTAFVGNWSSDRPIVRQNVLAKGITAIERR